MASDTLPESLKMRLNPIPDEASDPRPNTLPALKVSAPGVLLGPGLDLTLDPSCRGDSYLVDWITISQVHTQELPVVAGGFRITYDESGRELVARVSAKKLQGSHETALLLSCDGHRIWLSGNVGRLGRPDNVWGYDLDGILRLANRILAHLGLPAFSAGVRLPATADQAERWTGARIHRLDITQQLACGNLSQARAYVRWLQGRSLKRISKGQAGNESVWWANTRMMLKCYIKALEMIAHGQLDTDPVYQFCRDAGIVRLELELKRRTLADHHCQYLGQLTMGQLIQLHTHYSEPLRTHDASSDADLLDNLTPRLRTAAAAWLAGVDLRATFSRATYFRYLRQLKEHGLDISQPRDVTRLPVKIRTIDLQPAAAPHWYWERSAAA